MPSVMGPEVLPAEKSEHLPFENALTAFYASERFLSLKENTRSFYQGDLKGFQKSLTSSGIESISQITPQVIVDYLASLQRSPATLTRYRASTKTFLKWAGAERLVDPSLADRLPKRPKLEMGLPPSYLSDEKATELIEKSRRNLRNLALVTLALNTGARSSEILDLDVADILFPNERLLIRFTNKDGKARINYLEGESAEIIKQHAAKQKSGPLFCSTRGPTTGERLSRQNFHLAIRELGKTINLPYLNPRILRNTFVRNFEGNPVQLATELGIGYSNASKSLER